MGEVDHTQIWIVILVMAVATFVVRFSFLGLIGDRELPQWLLRMLRYTPVAVLPAVVTPMIISNQSAEPLRIVAALATIVAGLITRSVLWAILTGFLIFFGGGLIFG